MKPSIVTAIVSRSERWWDVMAQTVHENGCVHGFYISNGHPDHMESLSHTVPSPLYRPRNCSQRRMVLRGMSGQTWCPDVEQISPARWARTLQFHRGCHEL